MSFIHWLPNLPWWQYIPIVYLAGIPVTMAAVYDGVRTGQLRSQKFYREQFDLSPAFTALMFAFTALIAGMMWPYLACRRKWWMRVLGMTVPNKEDQ